MAKAGNPGRETPGENPDPENPDSIQPHSLKKREVEISGDGIPEGVKAFLKPKPWLREGQEFRSELYRKVPLGTAPGQAGRFKEEFVVRLPNFEIDEAWCQEKNLIGTFVRWIKWDAPAGEMSFDHGVIHVGPPLGENGTMPAAVTPAPAGGQAPAPAPAPSHYPVLSPEEIEDRATARLVMLLRLVKENSAAPAAAPASPIPDWMDKHMDRTMKRADDMLEKLETRVYSPILKKPAEDEKGAFDAKGMVKEFMPKISKWLDTLIGDGPVGEFMRAQVIDDAQFKEVWKDEGKRQAVAQALVEHLGPPGGKLFSLIVQQAEKAFKTGP